MKPVTKSALKICAILGAVFLAFCIVGFVHASSFAPDDGADTFAKLQAQGVPMERATRIANPADHICVFGDIDAVAWTIPSGPPAYLFDPSGKLVDFTLDVGDRSTFQDDYAVHAGINMSIAEVAARFGSAKTTRP